MPNLGSREWGVLSAVHRRIEDRLDKIDEALIQLKQQMSRGITIALTVDPQSGSDADSDTDASAAGTQEDPIVIA